MYLEYIPPRPLRSRVECVWTSHTTDKRGHTVYPDGCMDILYRRDSHRSHLSVVGTMTRAEYFEVPAGTQFAALRFFPGHAHGLPAADLVDRQADLSDVMRIGDLQRQLDDAPAPAVVLANWFAHRALPLTVVEEALESLVDLDRAAADANLSLRQFRRKCIELTGISPRRLARILRFRRAQAMAADAPDWARIAADAGYFDQSHLIRDFREFAGAPPMAVFSNTAGSPES